MAKLFPRARGSVTELPHVLDEPRAQGWGKGGMWGRISVCDRADPPAGADAPAARPTGSPMSRARLVGGNSGRASYDAVPQSLAIEPAPVPAGKQLLPSKPNEAGATIWGSLLAVLAALAAAADPMWTRHLSLHTHSDWVTMVYREVFSAIIILMYMAWEHDGFAKIDFGARNAKTAYGVGLLTCLLATSLWTFALLQTSVLHNTVCFSLAPVWTVAMQVGHAAFRGPFTGFHRLSLRFCCLQYALSMHDNLSGWDALLTATIVFCAVTILFFETDSENGIEGAGERAPTFAGDMMALGGGLCFGAYLTCCRCGTPQHGLSSNKMPRIT